MFKKVERILVVGLGNPGTQYEKTRHNVGFNAIEQLLPHLEGAKTKNKFDGELILGELFGKEVILLRPQTFMNNSGQCVGAVARFYKIKPQDVYVIFDDVSLNPGQLRIRPKGSPGGHNGIKSLIVHLGTDAFMHVKVGVGAKPHPDYDLADWVLSSFSAQEEKALTVSLPNAADAALAIIDSGVPEAANRFNGTHP